MLSGLQRRKWTRSTAFPPVLRLPLKKNRKKKVGLFGAEVENAPSPYFDPSASEGFNKYGDRHGGKSRTAVNSQNEAMNSSAAFVEKWPLSAIIREELQNAADAPRRMLKPEIARDALVYCVKDNTWEGEGIRYLIKYKIIEAGGSSATSAAAGATSVCTGCIIARRVDRRVEVIIYNIGTMTEAAFMRGASSKGAGDAGGFGHGLNDALSAAWARKWKYRAYAWNNTENGSFKRCNPKVGLPVSKIFTLYPGSKSLSLHTAEACRKVGSTEAVGLQLSTSSKKYPKCPARDAALDDIRDLVRKRQDPGTVQVLSKEYDNVEAAGKGLEEAIEALLSHEFVRTDGSVASGGISSINTAQGRVALSLPGPQASAGSVEVSLDPGLRYSYLAPDWNSAQQPCNQALPALQVILGKVQVHLTRERTGDYSSVYRPVARTVALACEQETIGKGPPTLEDIEVVKAVALQGLAASTPEEIEVAKGATQALLNGQTPCGTLTGCTNNLNVLLNVFSEPAAGNENEKASMPLGRALKQEGRAMHKHASTWLFARTTLTTRADDKAEVDRASTLWITLQCGDLAVPQPAPDLWLPLEMASAFGYGISLTTGKDHCNAFKRRLGTCSPAWRLPKGYAEAENLVAEHVVMAMLPISKQVLGKACDTVPDGKVGYRTAAHDVTGVSTSDARVGKTTVLLAKDAEVDDVVLALIREVPDQVAKDLMAITNRLAVENQARLEQEATDPQQPARSGCVIRASVLSAGVSESTSTTDDCISVSSSGSNKDSDGDDDGTSFTKANANLNCDKDSSLGKRGRSSEAEAGPERRFALDLSQRFSAIGNDSTSSPSTLRKKVKTELAESALRLEFEIAVDDADSTASGKRARSAISIV